MQVSIWSNGERSSWASIAFFTGQNNPQDGAELMADGALRVDRPLRLCRQTDPNRIPAGWRIERGSRLVHRQRYSCTGAVYIFYLAHTGGGGGTKVTINGNFLDGAAFVTFFEGP